MSRSSLSVAPQVLAEDGKPAIVLKKRKFIGRTVLVLWCRVCRTDRDCEHMQKKKDWIKFVDAQKEIDRLNYLLLKYNQEAVDYEQEVESEHLELKQKLDAFHLFLVKLHNQSRDVRVMAFLRGIIKKFEELLKEESEVNL